MGNQAHRTSEIAWNPVGVAGGQEGSQSGGMNRSKHVCVLMGGWSGAREASLRAGRACGEALQQQGFRVTRIDVGRDIANVLQTLKPDAVLNLVHGRPG